MLHEYKRYIVCKGQPSWKRVYGSGSYVGFDKTNTANLFYSCLIQKVVFNKWNVLLEKNLLH